MELVIIEKKTFDEIVKSLNLLKLKIEGLSIKHNQSSLKKWLDNQDVCLMLKISLRNLQNLRQNGSLPYTQINHKIFYKIEDVELLIKRKSI